VHQKLEDYVRSLGLGAYLVGGAVRDELLGLDSKDADFLVPGVDHAQLRAALESHGRIEDLEVAGQLVGVRLWPREKELRTIARSGIEFAPPRRERSTGPGRHDFEIVVDADATVEDDLGRRDFTINAIARRLEDGAVVDPFDGAGDLEDRVLRTVSPHSFAEDPLRIVRGLRFVSQLDLSPDETTLQQMVDEAVSIRLVSAERIGGGLHADGLGELSKLLLGGRPGKALRIARDTGVLVALIPEFARAIDYEQSSARQNRPLDEHIFAVVQNAADAGAPLEVRLGALFHDLGKPEVDELETGGNVAGQPGANHAAANHAAIGARITDEVLERLRYPTRVRRYVVDLVGAHAFPLDDIDDLFARRFLQAHGEQLAFDLVAHKLADLGAKQVPPEEVEAAQRLRRLLEQERSNPHRLTDLVVDGADLLELGYRQGPRVGAALNQLLDDVVLDPRRNKREWLLERAKELIDA
jgi:tRNA nucleotidyltransferase (CCA-adding enzyme)